MEYNVQAVEITWVGVRENGQGNDQAWVGVKEND